MLILSQWIISIFFLILIIWILKFIYRQILIYLTFKKILKIIDEQGIFNKINNNGKKKGYIKFNILNTELYKIVLNEKENGSIFDNEYKQTILEKAIENISFCNFLKSNRIITKIDFDKKRFFVEITINYNKF